MFVILKDCLVGRNELVFNVVVDVEESGRATYRRPHIYMLL